MAIGNRQKALNFLFFSVAAVIILLQTNCANETAPTGGKKDETPPKIKAANPPNETIHFTSNKIQITFSEFVQNTGFAQTSISPQMDKKPVFSVAGKTLTIKLKSDLKPNTTYTINFGDDIKDVNEGNVLSNFTYVFSTGDYIDSQRIAGKVINAKDGLPAEGVVVGLYSKDSVDGIEHSKPMYFAKTGKDGTYKIGHVKADIYSVYALKDQNYNYIYDQPNELIGFLDTLVKLTDTVPARADFSIFSENVKKVSLMSPVPMEAGKLMLPFNGPVHHVKLSGGMLPDSNYYYWKYPTKDTVILWYSKYYDKKDSLITAINDTIFDTARMELKFIEKDSFEHTDKYALGIVNEANGGKLKPNIKKSYSIQGLYGELKINLSRPIMGIDDSKELTITEDSTPNSYKAPIKIDPKTKQYISLDFPRKEGTKYTVEIPDSSLKEIFGTWNKALTWSFQTNKKDAYGNINLKITPENKEKHYIVNLYNSKDELVKQVVVEGEAEKKVPVPNIPAGDYHITVIDDVNKNGEWDTGNLKERRQPENIITLQNTYTLKGGWDLDAEVKF